MKKFRVIIFAFVVAFTAISLNRSMSVQNYLDQPLRGKVIVEKLAEL